ncbi:MAG: hypothetical protein NT023_13865 [Armatimonadetes bacterium]|nr:hypothetical protein [Armatimonadota bacterium]
MALDTLGLLKCAVQGTSVSEQGKSVSVKPIPGETVLFFRSDTPEFRACTRLEQNAAACDVMIFYYKSPKAVICFVELKGSEIGSIGFRVGIGQVFQERRE